MQPSHFVTIRCPSCGSGDVLTLEHGRFSCRHCQSSFLYTGERPSRPVAAVERTPSSAGALVAVVAMVVLLVFGGGAFFLFFAARDVPVSTAASAPNLEITAAPRPVAAATSRPVPAAAPSPLLPKAIATPQDPEPEAEVDAPPPQLSDYQLLRGCSCAKGRVQLHVLSNGRTTSISGAGVTITRHLDFAAVGADQTMWRMPITETSAPASSYDKGDISMGVGCKDDTLVVAAGTTVSAWSLSKHTLLWSHVLETPYGRYDAGDGASMGIDCDTLRPGKDAVAVRVGKRTVKLSLADGSPR